MKFGFFWFGRKREVNHGELEKKVDNLLKEIDFSELGAEPMYDKTTNFLTYLAGLKKENKSPIPHVISVSHDEFNMLGERFMAYDDRRQKEYGDRVDKAERLFSKFLTDELNISFRDINTLADPFYVFGIEEKFFNFLGKYNFSLRIVHKGKKIMPLDRFKARYKKNKCFRLSRLYSESLYGLIDYWKGCFALDHDKRVFDKVEEDRNLCNFLGFEPWEKDKIVEIKKNIDIKRAILEGHKKNLRDGLVYRIKEISTTYNKIKNRYNSLAEYFERDMLGFFKR